MPEYVSTTPGLYPLPELAKEELSDLKGHQKHDLVDGDESDEVRAVYDTVRGELVDRQEDAGLDRIVEGQARWDDMLAHPLAVHDAVDTGGLVRYYDNNNFYREPVVRGALAPNGDIGRELEVAATLTDDLQAVVPGPYSLFDLATDEHYGSDDAFLSALGEFVAGEVEDFPEHETLFVLEPSLVVEPPEGLYERAVKAIDEVVAASDADVVVHTYWGAMTDQTYAHLLDTDADAVGHDLVTAPEANLELVSEYGTAGDVALGVVDGQNTLVESAETIRERLDWFEERTPGVDVDTIYATPNTELFYLPVERFERKLAALGSATAEEVVA